MLYNLLLFLLGISMIVLEWERTRFIGALKNKRCDVWEALERPAGYFLGYFFRLDGGHLGRFILKRRYRGLGDSELRSIGDRFFYAQVSFWLLLAISVVLLALQFFSFSTQRP